ncbi:MAG TPA: sulfite exporter TauE/SafE family protein [Tepidisphaeraceae bacterium]
MELGAWQVAALLVVGGVIGVLGGMLGIGGGVLVIPMLVTFFGLSYRQAVGTSLGMLLPPIGIFAFLEYWRTGNVNLWAAMMLAVGFAFGAYFGGRVVATGRVPVDVLRTIFAFFLLYIAGFILFRTDVKVRPVVNTLVMMGAVGLVYGVLRAVGRRWDRMIDFEKVYREQVEVPLAPDYEI